MADDLVGVGVEYMRASRASKGDNSGALEIEEQQSRHGPATLQSLLIQESR